MARRLFSVLVILGLLTAGCKKTQKTGNQVNKTPANTGNATKSVKQVNKSATKQAGLVAPEKFSGTMAIVNGEKLDAAPLNRDLARLTQNGKRKLPPARLARVERSVLNRLIDEMLIDQAAKKAGVQVSDADVQKEFDKYKARFASPTQFERYMKMSRMSVESIKNWLKKKLTLEKLLDKQGALTVTEDEAKKVYQNNIRLYSEPERVKLQGILVRIDPKAPKADQAKAKNKVKAVLDALSKGQAFSDVAKKFSDDPTASKGGDMGWVRRDMLPKPLEDAVFALKPGTYTKKPVKGPMGLYIFKVLEKKAKKVRTFNEVKDRIMSSLRNRKVFTARLKLVRELRDKAKIDIKVKFGKNTKGANKVKK